MQRRMTWLSSRLNKKFIDRLKANNVRVVTVDAVDKARVIREKVSNSPTRV